MDVPPLPAVRVDVHFQVTPVGLNGVGVCASRRVDETDPVVHGLMRVTLRAEIIVSRPIIANDLGAWFDPSTNDGRQSCTASVSNGHEERSLNNPRRTSSRNKKVPITMSNDFLWQGQLSLNH